MKAIPLLLIIAMASTSMAEDDFPLRMSRPRSMDEVDPWARTRYQERLAERRVYALEARRAINSQRPPARGWTAIRVNVNPIGPIAIQGGWIWQPPIYRAPSYIPYRFDPFVPSCSR